MAASEPGRRVSMSARVALADFPFPERSQTPHRNRRESEAKDNRKWLRIINNWDKYRRSKSKHFTNKVLRGIPDSFRGEVWQRLLDPDFETARDRPTLQSIIDQGRKPCVDEIESDLKRTLPQCALFEEPLVLESLKRILHAYSNIDEELGYSQGMAFFAAFLVMFLEETSAFWCFHNLMRHPKFNCRELFLPGFPRVVQMNKVWKVILKTKCKHIYAFLERAEVDPFVYTTSWWLVSFLSCQLELQTALTVFDRFVVFGSRAVLSFGLAILVMHKDAIIQMDVDGLIRCLQSPKDSPMIRDWKKVMKKWDEMWISKDDFKRYLDAANCPQFY